MTVEEMRDEFMNTLRGYIDYWRGEMQAGRTSPEGAISGVVHSVLAVLSGQAAALPSFDLVPAPHEEDEAYQRENGENWWVPEDINTGVLGWHLYNGTPEADSWRERDNALDPRRRQDSAARTNSKSK
jgi:hypothetical protein